MSSPVIRDERPGDEDAISSITQAAFAHHPHSRQTEHLIIAALRRSGALSVSLVAERDGRVIGHVAFSPVTVSGGGNGWFGLGPVSVDPAFQRQGIGRALVEAGITRLRRDGARGCVLVGDPAFYGRFGFAALSGLVLEGVPPEVFLALPLAGQSVQGRVTFHPAFSVEA